MSQQDWPFADPPDLAVISLRRVIDGEADIALVTHGADDGGWQFLSHETAQLSASDGVVVGLAEIVEMDPTLLALADLPLGWCAWRPSKTAPWQFSKIE